MKTILSAIASVFLMAESSIAQPLLTHHEKFTAGTAVNYYLMDTTAVNTGPAGPNTEWDFSSLLAIGQTYTRHYLQPGQTEMGDSFPTATHAEAGNDGTTVYMLEKNDTVYALGMWLRFTNILIRYTVPQKLVIRPQVYNVLHPGVACYNYQYTAYSYKSGGTYSIKADGYGKLLLPAATYSNVLRVRRESLYYDTLQGPGSYVQLVHKVTYSWYNEYESAPLLEMDSISIQSPFFNNVQRTVYMHKNPANLISVLDKTTVKVWMNATTLFIEGIAEKPAKNICIYSVDGRLIEQLNIPAPIQSSEYTLKQPLTQGVYVITLVTENGIQTTKCFIQ